MADVKYMKIANSRYTVVEKILIAHAVTSKICLAQCVTFSSQSSLPLTLKLWK